MCSFEWRRAGADSRRQRRERTTRPTDRGGGRTDESESSNPKQRKEEGEGLSTANIQQYSCVHACTTSTSFGIPIWAELN